MGKGTILVVDDEKFIVDLLLDVLEIAGYRVYTATDSGAAPTVAQAVQPDLILLDIMMPGINGIEISKRLHADPRTARIPIVALTALPNAHDIVANTPIDDLVAKPFDLQELLQRVDQWIDHLQGSG